MHLTAPQYPVAIAAALLVIASLASSANADDPKQVCTSSYEQTQAARKQGKLSVAREKAILCSQEACPPFIRVDCAQWFTEIDASAPTVVLDVRDRSGAETSAVRVLLDGSVVKETLDGNALVLDPGEHMLRFELSGAPPKEQHLLAREGEKNRRVSVSFADAAPTPIPSPPPRAEKTSEPSEPSAGTPAAVYVLGGVGVVGIGLFATFGILGRNAKSDLEASCAPNCKPSQVGAVRAKLIAADVSLGVAVVSLGVATYLFFSAPKSARPTKPNSALEFTATPLPNGALGAVGGRF